jgi:hypothetical protein
MKVKRRAQRWVTLCLYTFNLALDVMNNNQYVYPQRTGPRKKPARKDVKEARK